MTLLIQWLCQKQRILNNLTNLETTWYAKVILLEDSQVLVLSDELSKALSLLGSWSSENYFGTLRSSLMSQRATLSRAREPDWWVAAKGVGTYISRVLMPKPICYRGKNAVKKAGTTNSKLKWLGMDNQIHKPPHSPIKALKICILKFSQVNILATEEIQTK